MKRGIESAAEKAGWGITCQIKWLAVPMTLISVSRYILGMKF
jgi:hypothetical protein